MWGRTAVIGDSMLFAFAFGLGFGELLEGFFGRVVAWAGAAGLPLGLALGIWVARILNRRRTGDPLSPAQGKGVMLAVAAAVFLAVGAYLVQGEWVGSGGLQPMAVFPIMSGAVATALVLDTAIDLARTREHLALDAVRVAALTGIGLVLGSMAAADLGMFEAVVNTLTPFTVVVAAVAAAVDLSLRGDSVRQTCRRESTRPQVERREGDHVGGHESAGTAPASWQADPMGRHQYRYWDGVAWTDNVADDGQASIDALSAAPDPVAELRRREAEVESEILELEAEIKKAAASPDDADMAAMLLADIEARMHGGVILTRRSPLTQHTQLQGELESIRRQIAEAQTDS